MKKIAIVLLSTFLLFNISCEDYLDVNKNIDAPDYVDDYLYLKSILTTYHDIYWDLRAVAPITQMWSTTSFTTFANHYYAVNSDNGGQIWRTVYWNQGMNLENMINQAIKEEHYTLAGIGYAIKAYSWDMLTKLHGDLPMKQAFTTGRSSYDYDYQNEIYPQVREWALTAIEYLEKPDKTTYGSRLTDNDIVYGGDAAKWKKFAYAVLVRNLTSLSNKKNFTAEYADKLIEYAEKSFQSTDDDAVVSVMGGSLGVPQGWYNNFWGTTRNNMSTSYFQSDYAVQIMTGTVPKYAQDGKRDKVDLTGVTHEDSLRYAYYPYHLDENQIITDTTLFDPRAAVKLSTINDPFYNSINKVDSIKNYKFYGGRTATSRANPIDGTNTPQVFGRIEAVRNSGQAEPNDGKGRWLYHDEAPYILTTYAEIRFCLAEAYWKQGNRAAAYNAFKEGVRADMDFTKKHLKPGTAGKQLGGDKITATAFQQLADNYLASKFVDALGDGNLSLSHIMMQKWIALYPWGAMEAWVDLRKYHYDIAYTGDYPKKGDGWDNARYITHKAESDNQRVYKGFYLGAAKDIESRNAPFNVENDGAPCYRLRPRYNSEYVWNLNKLGELKPIPGNAPNYHTSIPWFAYPGDYPVNP
ncbi:MAG: SusD/RagB family nutrient-binding outer membrane lipoprotein [Bacteroidia bacterium]|nr:SusD/RagB family nutrient-binding outer membrane lipoprotein [Bacteroidia bacterium]